MFRTLRGMVGALILGVLVAGGPAPAQATTTIRDATVPSGPLPVPATLSQWRLVAYDDFTDGLNPLLWGAYSGQPGGDPGGWWSPSHVVVTNGILNLETYRDPNFGGRWVSGGVSNAPGLKQTYGKYEIRVRVGTGRGVAFAALLWPVGSWPPEIDFDELGGATNNRYSVAVALHYGRHDSQIQRGLKVNPTRWHTVGVEWLPGQLNFTIDDRRWAVIRSPEVPDQPMELDLQTQAGTCDQWWAPCPDTQTPPNVDAQIQWVAEYAYAPIKRPPGTIWTGVSQFAAW